MIQTYKSISELRTGAKQACEYFITECKKQGLSDVAITETYRSQARQDELYAQGRTKPGKMVTNAKKSSHTDRYAWDIFFTKTAYSDVSKFDRAGKIARSLGITWGGDFKTITDKPHFEYKNSTFKEPNNMTNTEIARADRLASLAKQAGIISDAELWSRYMTGELKLSGNNLMALFDKVLAQIKNKAQP